MYQDIIEKQHKAKALERKSTKAKKKKKREMHERHLVFFLKKE